MPHVARRRVVARAFTLIELLVVVVILAVLISLLLPALSNLRQSAADREMAKGHGYAASSPPPATPPPPAAEQATAPHSTAGQALTPAPPALPLALVKSFVATVDLTPRLSVGTAEPESIYEAKFTATLEASAPPSTPSSSASASGLAVPCEIHLPLPPQVISLADLSVTVNGEPSDAVTLRDAALVWTGPLPAAPPTPIKVTYAAVGKGLYALRTPPGRILDTFSLDLVANGSDVRMLELSLQPTALARGAGRTTYSWNYPRLMFGRPIAVDVLGVAPVDRLGELRWLGPLSVVVFGLVVGLYAHAHALIRFDRWMLLLTLGAFTGAYPLMYFAQAFIPLAWAVVGSAALMTAIVAARAWTIIGPRHALLGVALPAAATLALALVTATHPALQGLLLTTGAIAVFVTAMTLIPRVQWTPDAAAAARPTPAI